MAALAALIVVILVTNVQRPSVILSLVVALAACMAAFGFALTRVSHQLRREQTVTRSALISREKEFLQMAGNIQETFWMIDANTKKPLYVNEAMRPLPAGHADSSWNIPLLVSTRSIQTTVPVFYRSLRIPHIAGTLMRAS